MVGEFDSPSNWITGMSLMGSRTGYVAAFSRIESTLSDLGKTLNTVENKMSAIKIEQDNQKQQIVAMESDWRREMKGVVDAVGDISKEMKERDRPKTSIWIAGIGVFLAFMIPVLGASAVLVEGSIAGATEPIKRDVVGLQQLTSNLRDIEDKAIRSREADARSEMDRQELNRRVASIENIISNNTTMERTKFASLDSGFRETETQFKNLTAMTYYLWHIVTGTDYPIIPRENPMEGNK